MIRDRDEHPVRVLIVENDPRVRAALSTFLSASTGFEIIGDVGNAPAALELARSHTPDVALVDILIPDAPAGLGLLRTLTSELRIPAVAISIRSSFRHSALAAGACQFVDKDSTPELLLPALRASASRQPHQSS